MLQQYSLPRWWGHGRTEPTLDVEVFYPIPINVIVSLWDRLYWWLTRAFVVDPPTTPEQREVQRLAAEALVAARADNALLEEHYLRGWRSGYEEAHFDISLTPLVMEPSTKAYASSEGPPISGQPWKVVFTWVSGRQTLNIGDMITLYYDGEATKTIMVTHGE